MEKKTAPATLTRGSSIGGGGGFARHDFYALKKPAEILLERARREL
jgi:hypothetical protein